jgi:TadE-like protein
VGDRLGQIGATVPHVSCLILLNTVTTRTTRAPQAASDWRIETLAVLLGVNEHPCEQGSGQASHSTIGRPGIWTLRQWHCLRNHVERILRCSCKWIAAHRSTAGNRSGGQSLVEFALVLPLLLVLVLTIADFGRLFSAGITIESAARTAAETASAEYLREAQRVAPGPVTLSGYTSVHQAAWQSVCDEASSLPNATPGSGGGECDGLPTVVCVHDGVDPLCADAYNAGGGIPAGCPSLQAGTRPTDTQLPESGSNSWPYVEVRVCYRFSALLRVNIPFIGGTLSTLGGNFFLERSRTFSVANYN